jgi:hypothetical protein
MQLSCTYFPYFTLLNFDASYFDLHAAITVTYFTYFTVLTFYAFRSAFYMLLFTFDAGCRCYIASAAPLLCFTLLYFDTFYIRRLLSLLYSLRCCFTLLYSTLPRYVLHSTPAVAAM